MICLTCQHVESGEHAKHAKVGLGTCKFQSLPGVFVSLTYRRDCAQFKSVTPDVEKKRKEWEEKL